MKYRALNQGQTTTPGTPFPTLYEKWLGSSASPASHVTLKVQETGPTERKKKKNLQNKRKQRQLGTYKST